MENLKRLFNYLKPYKRKFIYAMFCMVFVAMFQSLIMLLIKPAMDKIFALKQKEFLLPIAAGIIITGFLKFVFSYLQSYLLSWMGQAVVRDLRNEMYEKLMNLSMNYFIKSSTGKLISRLTYDVSLIQRAIVMIPRNTLRDGLYVIFYLGILFYLNWIWTLAIFVAFPIISIVILKIGKKIKRRAKRVQELTADIYSILQEKITGIKLIKSVVTEKEEIEKMQVQNHDYFNLLMRLTKADILQSPLIEFLGVTGVAIIVVWGGMSVMNGSSTLGTFIAFIATSISMYRPVKSLTDVNTDIQTAFAAAERIFEILDEKPTVIEIPQAVEMPEFKNEIIFENVSFEYVSGKPVLSNINFTVKKGEVVAIVGPSGCGKTTIINLLARFFDPTHGIVSIDGADIKNFTLKSLRCQMGIVTQETILFNDTVSNNISYGMQNTNFTDIETAAKKANAGYFIEKLPKKYDTVIGERGVTLSGGERQRLAIARVILRNPQILILDEATSALDSESEMLVQDALSRIMEGKTTVVIAHRLSTVKSADKIIVIAQGKTVAIGTHSELIEKSSLYKQLYELQDIT
ncbi:MAG TPA: ABC transporter ATP-binding protein [Elusimicrobia bacterium]|nr:ABC transporter ATP-binding protein [Elusimicrobiota bacterium]